MIINKEDHSQKVKAEDRQLAGSGLDKEKIQWSDNDTVLHVSYEKESKIYSFSNYWYDTKTSSDVKKVEVILTRK